MTAKKSGPDRVVLDAVAMDIAPRGTEASTGDIIREGTSAEMRKFIGWFGTRLRHHDSKLNFPPIPDFIYQWFGDALESIGVGEDPKKVLGLNRKRKHGPQHRNIIAYMVDDLVKQGRTRGEAETIVGNYDHATHSFKSDPGDTAGARVGKVINRKVRTK